MEEQAIRFLTPYQPANKLHIRVCRIWVTKSIGDNPQPISLDCVFVDKDRDAVHGTINGRDIQFFLDRLSVGNAYEINKFRVIHNKRSSKVVPHAAIIELNRKTTIVPIHKTSQELPMHWFNLIELNQLHQRIDNDVELTDVFGCLTAVQPTEEITIQNTRVAKKINLNLQNIRDETVRITLWGETATGFETSGIQELLPPVFCAFTSLKVKQYQGKPVLGSTGSTVCVFNPEIPQLSEYKHKFKHSRSPLQILPTSAEMYTGHAVSATTKSKTIDELLLLDPALHKNASFVCQATIVEFDLTKGWWYKSCPSCHKVVKKNSESFECNEHGFINRLPEPWFKIDLIVEDSTNQHNFLMIGRHAEKILRVSCHTLVIEDGHEDPFILPPTLKNLVGTTKQFQLSFGNQNTDFGKTDFIVHGLLQDQPLSSPTIALVIPKTPTPSVGTHIMTQATPSPVMPSHRPNQQPQLVAPTKTSKRALFPNEADKSDSKKPRSDQTDTTNSARIAKEFHNLVVPKIEPANKVPIATLKTKSQTKKTKDSAEDVHSQKKLTPQSP
ncbi:replication protein A 70 kDa DNA-binding subunit B-like isoform X1 [Pyrus x bretschneideri]|uniref:replication protein A 70 kDa DNA-binding subunit B-like isoform X1 n=1 Tax=Pyrus x bretschneideri TaxID=225117 RepID=UPI0008709EAD|nr:replication protein A 70 kDa DNA-binding subunit B-like isoform X1 [Pyrus x bretschneideri]XP_048431118.1 replication protein A 70 kDa DNA-binding subunit B-like isoform X1 [Pyrus x bretschneideri]XP_048431124.1 replication protein A 70 kDa DNA-binding subunit B-like isoform X1 [Pyrus x bretschneideri]XP_048431129.1 replication protein A 70 kDa DNA-binding subunit B-like isoform X1 [Pyrus x bretschneideri]XP_048431132.1 replication protein A 70 kDa DNA-binding subunit B-like isoform X1 [Pyru